MGLDMYLERIDREAIPYKSVDLAELKASDRAVYETMKPHIKQRGNESFCWESLFELAAYWRKANQIHQWFVEHVQDGEDDCSYHREVTKNDLTELCNLCKEVLSAHNNRLSEKLLPTQGGFFFGSTKYDEWYYKDIQETITALENVLKETDFSKQALFYCSSW